MASVNPNLRVVSEPVRERETFRYHPSIAAGSTFNLNDHPLTDAELLTSYDPVLTALAQLGTFKLNCTRAIISLFDADHQYIVAEATPTLPLGPRLDVDERGERLWICGTAIPRRHGVCEYALLTSNPDDFEGGDDPAELPLALVSDLTADPRFWHKPYCQPGTPMRFYAAVPIRSPRGINIGVFCVMHHEPRELTTWKAEYTRVIRELSRTCMEHLEFKRSMSVNRRNERMTKGLGSLIEGKAAISGPRCPSRNNVNPSPHPSCNDSFSGASFAGGNPRIRRQEPEKDESSCIAEPQQRDEDQSPGDSSEAASKSGSRPTEDDQNSTETAKTIFSRATNILRDAVEAEGVIFLDGTVKTFGGLTAHMEQGAGLPHANRTYSSTSSDGSGYESANDDTKGNGNKSMSNDSRACRVIGFSTTQSSSIDGAESPPHEVTISERFLARLFRRYPRGKIFNFDKSRSIQSIDSSEEGSLPTSPEAEDDMELGSMYMRIPQPKRGRHRLSKQREGAIIARAFPGACSVAFVPVWNARKERWFAGGFAYSHTPTRVFSAQIDLCFLKAMGTLAMNETFQCQTSATEKAKSDVLSSISHELRSPLHGVVLGVELLRETQLDVFQANVLHTLEICSRTLVDTIDHLLDYTKINNFATSSMKKRSRTNTKDSIQSPVGWDTNIGTASIEDGMKSLYSDVGLDVLCEEVVESVFAGFNMQDASVHRLLKKSPDPDPKTHETDTGEAPPPGSGELGVSFGSVTVFVDVDPTCSWTFRTQPGAIRRIIMNVFGNSLKYTHSGTIRLSLRQEPIRKKRKRKYGVPDVSADGNRDDTVTPPCIVKLTVADTGRGISEDYLRNDLFCPFSQEDRLAPGTGLGLSLVKQITSQLQGTISVDSRVGVGTTVSIWLPLVPCPVSESVPPPVELPAEIPLAANDLSEIESASGGRESQLNGLRVQLVGFNQNVPRILQDPGNSGPGGCGSEYLLMENICRGWLGMDVVSGATTESEEGAEAEAEPHIIMCTHHSLLSSAASDLNGREGKQGVCKPRVVICANTLVAHRLAMLSQSTSGRKAGIEEFVSQPAGPRKLAKTLLLAYKRWEDFQTGQPLVDDPIEKDSFAPVVRITTIDPDPIAPYCSPTDEDHASSLDTLALEATETKVDRAQTKPVEEPPSENGPPASAASQTTFLIVDDNHINLRILSCYINKLSRPYVMATNGREALDTYMAAPEQHRCIFMDISMPVMDGFEATRRIRSFEAERGLAPATIVALSGLASEEAQAEAFGSGIDLFLSKPVGLGEVRGILTARGFL